jgi:hypothetical protein
VVVHNPFKEELNARHLIVEISWHSDLNILIFFNILSSKSEEMFVEVLGSIVRLLEAEYLVHIEIEASDEVGPLRVIVASTGHVLVLVDVAGLVVVALEEHIQGVVGPLVILFVVKLELVLDWLFSRLSDGLGRGHWLGGRGGGSLFGETED